MLAQLVDFVERLRDLPIPFREVSEDSASFGFRRWRYIPTYGFRNAMLELGIELRLIEYRSKATYMPARWAYAQLRLHPKEWKIGQDHMWYDGPHCSYSFGPFQFHKHWGPCTKCHDDC